MCYVKLQYPNTFVSIVFCFYSAATISWEKDGVPINITNNYIVHRDVKQPDRYISFLMIKDVTKADEGSYNCLATHADKLGEWTVSFPTPTIVTVTCKFTICLMLLCLLLFFYISDLHIFCQKCINT